MNRRVRTPVGAPVTPSTKPVRRAWREALGALTHAHLYSALSSLGRLATRPASSALSIGVMAIALALPLCLWVALSNLQRLSGSVEQSREVSVFMQIDSDPAAIASTAALIREWPGVSGVQVQTAEQGLAEFRALAGFDEALDLLDGNPIPAVLRVGVLEQADPDALQAKLGALPEVDAVHYDAEWQSRLDAWLRFGQHFSLTVAVLLGLGALLVVGNSVRLAIDGRADEIEIMQLLGGSDAFIRRPYLYLGAWMGLLAGATALGLLQAVLWVMQSPVSDLVSTYGGGFQLQGLGILHGMAVWALATGLGWVGAWLAAGHWLRRHRAGS